MKTTLNDSLADALGCLVFFLLTLIAWILQ